MKTKLPRRLPCKYCNRIVGTMRIGDHRYIELHGRQYGFTTPTKCPGSGQKVAERKMKKKKIGKYIVLTIP